ncbi:zinc-binding dehydrogenase [Synechococcus sp. HK01-R]|uniref:zinc-binding dehydrogenase n=1 Tax=Synechococcus sp. HK01-R TaxID=2751171 RepID=UPI00162373F9|nr:zinc-binding dehydrogenase [Synechococcus sp. HK01-R]QNG26871.1 zinc-binding dehydrogenase [Synechococcus sp. HK01-R]
MGVTVWQAREAGAPLERAERPMLEPARDELLLQVLHCGLCHSDLSMLDNHWGMSAYPLVPGLEVVGRVAVIGVGGLGHMALQFARAWGCEVTALTTNLGKAEEARRFGAHHVELLEALPDCAGRFDLVINTVNQSLDWSAVMASLAPLGRLHQLGAVLEPISVGAFDLIASRRSITGSPTSSPASLLKMVEFCRRHDIRPQVERLPMDRVNEAIERLRLGDVRYRFVLDSVAD